MINQKKSKRRITALFLLMTVISALLLATMAYADSETPADTGTPADTETPADTGTPADTETDFEYKSEEVKADGGFMAPVLRFFGKILSFCNKITGNYIFALFVFSLLIQILLCFVGIKQQKNSIGQAKLAPKVAAINKKYAGRTDQATMQKKQNEIMELYQKEGFNPMGGCLPLLIQMPIIMILYYVVIAPLQYIVNISSSTANNLAYMLKYFDSSFNEGAGRAVQMSVINWFRAHGTEGVASLRTWIADVVTPNASSEVVARYSESLTAIEEKLDVLPNFYIGPVNLANTPTLTLHQPVGGWLLLLVPVITLVTLLLTQSLTKKFTYQSPETVEAQKKLSMKIMQYAMPLLSVYFTFVVPAAIGVYWIFRNILNLVQQIILSKVMPIPKYSEEDYKAAERELMGSSQKKKERVRNLDPNRPRVRSLHHIDDEGYENGYKIDPNAPKEEEQAEKAGETTDNLEAPAPIKNDDKSTYTIKKKKS